MKIQNLARIKSIYPFLVVIIFPVLLFWELFLKGKVLYWGTTSLQFLPWLTFSWRTVLQGQIPLWNPFNGMGSPFIANYQSAFFYPPIWITFPFFALGGIRALSWGLTFFVVIHVIWAGVGMVFLVRRFHLPPLSQVICGLSFACSSYLLARVNFLSMVCAIAWFPWLMWAAELAITQINKKTFWEKVIQSSPLILCMTMQLLTGHAQITWYCLVFVVIWVFVGEWKSHGFANSLSVLIIIICSGIVAFLLASIQILPTLELLVNSQRALEVGYEYATNFSLWPWHLFTFLTPNVFGNPGYGTYWGYGSFWEDAIYFGFLPFVSALSTLKKIFRKSEHSATIIFLWCMTLISILLALGKNFPLFPFLYKFIPTFNLFQAPTRFMIWAIFSLSILAGFGISEWKRTKGWSLYLLRLTMMGLFALIIAGVIALFLVKGQAIAITFSILFMGFLGVITSIIVLWRNGSPDYSRLNKISFVVILIFISMDLLFASNLIIPLSQGQEKESASIITAIPSSNTSRTYFDRITIYNFYYSRFFRFDDFRFLENSENLHLIGVPNINLIKASSSANNFDPLLPKRYINWIDMLENSNEDTKVALLALMNVNNYIKINPEIRAGHDDISINDPNRIYWYSCAVFVENEEESFEIVTDWLRTNPELIMHDIVIESKHKIGESNCSASNTPSISILKDQGNEIEILVKNNFPGWLLMADIYYPGWEVIVDGKKQEIFPAQYAFRAIDLQPGKHDIIFTYRPASFKIGAIISLLSLILSIFLYVIARKISSVEQIL